MFPLFDTIPRRHIPLTTITLIVVNTLVFAMQLSLPRPALEQFLRVFGIVPAWFVHPAWAHQVGYSVSCCLPLVTSMFRHGGWLHLISNMWALWIFGDNVFLIRHNTKRRPYEDEYGIKGAWHQL